MVENNRKALNDLYINYLLNEEYYEKINNKLKIYVLFDKDDNDITNKFNELNVEILFLKKNRYILLVPYNSILLLSNYLENIGINKIGILK